LLQEGAELKIFYQGIRHTLYGVIRAVFMLLKLLCKAIGIRFIGMAIHGLVLGYGRSAPPRMADGGVIS
jgi:hypothetical protein